MGRLMSEVEYSDLTCPFPSIILPLNCTDSCSCMLNRKARETIMNCSNRIMTAFPSDLILVPKQSDSVRLHLEHNQIQSLCTAVERYRKTSDNNYKHITALHLSINALSSLHPERLPTNLTELILENNKIKYFKQTDIERQRAASRSAAE